MLAVNRIAFYGAGIITAMMRMARVQVWDHQRPVIDVDGVGQQQADEPVLGTIDEQDRWRLVAESWRQRDALADRAARHIRVVRQREL